MAPEDGATYDCHLMCKGTYRCKLRILRWREGPGKSWIVAGDPKVTTRSLQKMEEIGRDLRTMEGADDFLC
jgi:hypothetical protein